MRELLAGSRSIIESKEDLDVQRIENASIGAFFNTSMPAFSLQRDSQFSRCPLFMTFDPFSHFRMSLNFTFRQHSLVETVLSSQLSFSPFEDNANSVVTGRSDFYSRTLDNTIVVSFWMVNRVPRD